MSQPVPKGLPASERQEITHGQFLRFELRKDVERFKNNAALFFSSLSTNVAMHWGKAVVAILLLLPLVELFLQFTSLVAWPLIKFKESSFRASEFVVMCVGDSFTAGKFNSIQMPAYVNFLSDVLDTKNGDWKIVNVSSEYLTSGDVLRKTEDLVRKQRPDVVYLMIGINDIAVQHKEEFVLRPQPVMLDTRRPPFHTEIFFRKMREGFSLPNFLDVFSVPPWFLLEKPPLAGYRPEYLALSDSKLANLLAASSKANKPTKDLEEYTKVMEQQSSAWSLMRSGMFPSARQQFEAAVGLNQTDAVARAGLAETYYELGMHAEAKTEINWLRNHYRKHPEYTNARALLHAFPLENTPNDTSKIAVAVLQKYPQDSWSWMTLATACFRSSRLDYAKQAIDRALLLSPADMPEWKATLFRARADFLARTNRDEAIENLMQAYLLDQNEDMLIDALRKNGPYYLRANREAIARKLSSSTETRKNLVSLSEEALDKPLTQMLFSFETRLRRIVLRCQEYGVHPVLVGYPIPNAGIEQINRRVAEETGATWLNLSVRFEDFLRNNATERKFMNEGRYTNRAALKLAEWIADDASSRLFP